ncbi:MAG: thiamine diphosphokinase [Treponema sp.]|jgi:thiamine pyrophosphokinase|nr:thiamine diphosphokinase [Treponema sp.]
MKKQQGIVFTGGEGPQPELIRRLCEGPAQGALLAAADSGLLRAEAAGLKPDWIVGDMDSLGDQARLDAYPAERIMRHATDKDHTDTELALAVLWEKGCGEIWIVGGGGGRIDHLFAIRSLFERERFPCRWITAAEDIRCIDAADAQTGSLSLTLESGALVSVFPLGAGPWKVASRGLKWPLDDLQWNRGFFGLSNVAEAGTFSITAEQGRFMLVMPLPSEK